MARTYYFPLQCPHLRKRRTAPPPGLISPNFALNTSVRRLTGFIGMVLLCTLPTQWKGILTQAKNFKIWTKLLVAPNCRFSNTYVYKRNDGSYNLQYLSTKEIVIIKSFLQNPSRKSVSQSLALQIIRHVWKQNLVTCPDDAATGA